MRKQIGKWTTCACGLTTTAAVGDPDARDGFRVHLMRHLPAQGASPYVEPIYDKRLVIEVADK